MTDQIDYDHLVQDALRYVVRDTLKQVAAQGLPGNHHFYITFKTNRSDVHIPQYLKDKHPEDITIVLQHQFWDLEAEESHFMVSLSFNDVHERLKIPYAAIVSFMDPSVKFGLQFSPSADMSTAPLTDLDKNGEGKSGKVLTLDAFRKK